MQFADILEKIKIAASVFPATISGDTDGTAFDTRDCNGITAVVIYGTTTETTPQTSNRLYAKLQDSADNSSWADVDAANIVGASANLWAKLDGTDKDVAVYAISAINTRRYVRIHIEEDGTHNGTPTCAFILGLATIVPVSSSSGA